MKNYIFPFLLGIAVTISIAATTNSLTIFQPAKAKQSKVLISNSRENIQKFILDNIKQGYQVDKLGEEPNSSSAIIIMVKY